MPGCARRMRTTRAALAGVVAITTTTGLIAIAPAAADGEQLVIQTIAGGGAGDGAKAVEAAILRPVGVVATTGAILVSDAAAHRVRRIAATGTIRAFAGSGARGFGGDGGSATGAPFDEVGGVAVDRQGRVYIADTKNDRVRRVDAAGTVRTFAGGAAAPTVETPGAAIGDGGPADRAVLRDPTGVAVAPDGSVYIADTGNSRVRRVGTDGVITTVAGNGEEGDAVDGGGATTSPLDQPVGVAIAPDGALLVADRRDHRVWKVKGDVMTVFAGTGDAGMSGDGGQARAAQLNEPTGIAVDGRGRVLIADRLNNRIRRVAAGVITTIAGADGAACAEDRTGCDGGFGGDGAAATKARLNGPESVTVDEDGSVVVADTGNRRVRRIALNGVIDTIGGTGGSFAGNGGRAVGAALLGPAGVAVGPGGDVYVADTGHHRVRKVVASGDIKTIAGDGARSCSADAAAALVCPGRFAGDGGPATAASLSFPSGLAVTQSGTVYVADAGNNVVRRIDPAGTITTVAGNRANAPDGSCPPTSLYGEGSATSLCLAGPVAVAVDAAGVVFIADTGNNRVLKVDSAGSATTVAGGVVALPGALLPPGAPARLVGLAAPRGVAVGPEGVLLIADTENHRLLKVDATGAASVVAGTGVRGATGDGAAATAATLAAPAGLSADASGNVFVADTGNHRIRRIAASGVITTYAGGAAPAPGSFQGDRGAPAAATLAAPAAVAAGTANRVFIADTAHDRVRGVVPPAPEITLALDRPAAAVVSGQPLTVSGSVLRVGADPIAGVPVHVLARPYDSDAAVEVGDTLSRADGTFSLTTRPQIRTAYFAEVDEDPMWQSGASAAVTALVRWGANVTAPRTAVSIKAGAPLIVTGTVVPALQNTRVELVSVRGTAVTVLARAGTVAGGRFTFRKTFARGSHTVRVRVPAAAGRDAGESPTWTVRAA